MVGEIRQIQQVLQSDRNQTSIGCHRCPNSSRNDEITDFLNTITEERQNRLQLDHTVRKMELDFLEIKNEMQSCKARLQFQSHQNCNCICAANKLCSPPSTNHCCTCADEAITQRPPRATTLFTLV